MSKKHQADTDPERSKASSLEPKASRSKELTLLVHAKSGESEKQAFARKLLSPVTQAGLTALCITKQGAFPQVEMEINALVKSLEQSVAEVSDSGLAGHLEILASQAITLDQIFNTLTRRSMANIGTYMEAAQQYMNLALRAQSQTIATITAMDKFKSPKSAPLLKQTNIAHGPQQVNNNIEKAKDPGGGTENAPNELLEEQDGQRVYKGTSQSASGADSEVETVGEIDGAKVA